MAIEAPILDAMFDPITNLSFSVAKKLAPHTGHVSNSLGSIGPLIEPAHVCCFQSDSSAPPTLVQGGHPVWTRLELGKWDP